MIDRIIIIVSVILSVCGLYFLMFMWSNAELKSTFEKFNELKIIGSIRIARRNESSRIYRVSKRIFDIIFSLVALIFLSPILVLISAIIKVDSKGPILFKHSRIGINGKLFYSYKFRTMVMSEIEESTELPLKTDPRITKVGRFLRTTSIDELPAFINVITGDMSLVGRSRILDYHKTTITLSREEKEALLSIKPGLVGLWAVSFDRVKFKFDNISNYDFYYLSKMSFLFDLKILFGAFIIIFGSTSQH